MIDDAQDAHRSVYEGHHEGKLTHELAAGAAAFEGFKLFEDHQRKQGTTFRLKEYREKKKLTIK